MRILFAGTPVIAVPSLRRLAEKHEIAAVLTNPDRTAGRGRKLVYSPVKECALELGLSLLQPEKLDDSFIAWIRELDVDLMVVVAFGRIFKKAFLDLFPLGAVNLHPSRLPEYRGSSPLNAAIRDGLKISAVTIQKMVLKMDAGDILLQRDLPLEADDTVDTLGEKASFIGADMLDTILADWDNFERNAKPQVESEASYCHMIQKNDGLIDWTRSAAELDCFIRSVTPWPGAYSFRNKKKIGFFECSVYDGTVPVSDASVPGEVVSVDKGNGILIKTGDGLLAVRVLQPASKKKMDFKSFLNGNRDFTGTILGDYNE